jgi:hypothetical protein
MSKTKSSKKSKKRRMKLNSRKPVRRKNKPTRSFIIYGVPIFTADERERLRAELVSASEKDPNLCGAVTKNNPDDPRAVCESNPAAEGWQRTMGMGRTFRYDLEPQTEKMG